MAQKLFQQAIINLMWSRQLLSEEELQKISDKLCTHHQSPVIPIKDVIEQINPSLGPLGLEIRRGISESDGKFHFGMINTRNDELSQVATKFSAAELQCFKKMAKSIMSGKETGKASKADLLNLRTQLEGTNKMSLNEITDLISRLKEDLWLSETDAGTVSLGPRTLLEMRQYIESEYEEFIKECTICSDIVFEGEICSNPPCGTKLHHHCARQWFRGKARKCPACTQVWPDAPPGWEDNAPPPAPRQFHPNALLIE